MMTLKLFDEFGEAAEAEDSSQQTNVSFGDRLLYCVWASAVAFIPVLGATYSSLQVTRFFRSLTAAEIASAANVFTQLQIFNAPLIIALVISAFLAFGLAIAFTLEPSRRLASVGLPFSIGIPILAATPALFLWFAENTVVNVLSGKLTDTPLQVAVRTISNLIFCALGSGLLVQPVIIVCAIVSVWISARSRKHAFSLSRALVWLVAGMLLLALGGAYLVVV